MQCVLKNDRWFIRITNISITTVRTFTSGTSRLSATGCTNVHGLLVGILITCVAAYQSCVRQWPAVTSMPKKNGRQLGARSFIMLALPIHLVQELKTGIVPLLLLLRSLLLLLLLLRLPSLSLHYLQLIAPYSISRRKCHLFEQKEQVSLSILVSITVGKWVVKPYPFMQEK